MGKLEQKLSRLSYRKQLAFAAVATGRLLQEANAIGGSLIEGSQEIQAVLDLAWSVVTGGEPPSDEAETLFNALEEAVPLVDDPDELLAIPANAAESVLMCLLSPKKAAQFAAVAGEEMVDLVGLAYEDGEDAEDREEAWQDEVIKLLSETAETQLNRHISEMVPEYTRGAARSEG